MRAIRLNVSRAWCRQIPRLSSEDAFSAGKVRDVVESAYFHEPERSEATGYALIKGTYVPRTRSGFPTFPPTWTSHRLHWFAPTERKSERAKTQTWIWRRLQALTSHESTIELNVTWPRRLYYSDKRVSNYSFKILWLNIYVKAEPTDSLCELHCVAQWYDAFRFSTFGFIAR